MDKKDHPRAMTAKLKSPLCSDHRTGENAGLRDLKAVIPERRRSEFYHRFVSVVCVLPNISLTGLGPGLVYLVRRYGSFI